MPQAPRHMPRAAAPEPRRQQPRPFYGARVRGGPVPRPSVAGRYIGNYVGLKRPGMPAPVMPQVRR